jgi:hypothetical protein
MQLTFGVVVNLKYAASPSHQPRREGRGPHWPAVRAAATDLKVFAADVTHGPARAAEPSCLKEICGRYLHSLSMFTH